MAQAIRATQPYARQHMNSRSDFVFESRFSNKALIVLDALRTSDMQTALQFGKYTLPSKTCSRR
jgi:hypothetical protein